MFSPKLWLCRHLRQLRLALVLCLVVSYGTLLLLSIPIAAYFDQMRGASENPSTNPEDSTAFGLNTMSQQLLVPDPYGSEAQVGPTVIPSFYTTRPTSVFHSAKSDSSLLDSTNTTSSLNWPRSSAAAGGPWDLPELPILLNTWRFRNATRCDGRLELYAREFARLRSAIVDRRFCAAKAKGGEAVSVVLRQDEQDEYYGVVRHCFQLECGTTDVINYRFNGMNFMQSWLLRMKTADVKIDDQTSIEPGFTIAFMRREYANLYHTVNDWYNLFLMMVFFRRTPDQTNILLVDAHPKGNLDPAWSVLFNSTRMLSATPPRTLYPEMVWGMQGYNSVLKRSYSHGVVPPLIEEFRRFVLDRFRLDATRKLDCSNISVLFIWRHDYVAHPRNPSGEVQRKIANEEELLIELRRRHPSYRFEGVQIDEFSMRDQLRLVSAADVLVGMHGAGLSHTLFVQPHGATVELVPKYYGSGNDHFVNLARWRGLGSVRWVNVDPRLELQHYRTVVPVHVMDDLLNRVVGQICVESREARLEKSKNSAGRFHVAAAATGVPGRYRAPAYNRPVPNARPQLMRRPQKRLRFRRRH